MTLPGMDLPDYWLTRPHTEVDETTRSAFDTLLSAALAETGCPTIDYTLTAPKWQFLCHAAEKHDLALHGSGNPNIAHFEPRQSNDLEEFGNQKAVYAASDGIWPIFFAVVDRQRLEMSVNNGCMRLVQESGAIQGPYYLFSISHWALELDPWRTGTVYLLPRVSFVQQPPIAFGPMQVHVAQLASPVAVQPLAKITVTPADFPFLAQIRGHDDDRLPEYSRAIREGGPWPEDRA